MGDLPDMAIRISEKAVMPAPKHVFRVFKDRAASGFGGCKNLSDLSFFVHVIAHGHA